MSNRQLQDALAAMIVQLANQNADNAQPHGQNQNKAKCRYCGINGHLLKDCSNIVKPKQQYLENQNKNPCDHCGLTNHKRSGCHFYLKAKEKFGNNEEPIRLSELPQTPPSEKSENRSNSPGEGQQRQQATVQCQYCGSIGHSVEKCHPRKTALIEFGKNCHQNPCNHCGMPLHERSNCPLYLKAKSRLGDQEPEELNPMYHELQNQAQARASSPNRDICHYCGCYHTTDKCDTMITALQQYFKNSSSRDWPVCEHCGQVAHQRINCPLYKRAITGLGNRGEPMTMPQCGDFLKRVHNL